ncbi:MAG TPA: hypothetical protein EYH34_18210 [Planctomycetes bacterium]|nr:hypothetical protein [Planctomycetota bacterium]
MQQPCSDGRGQRWAAWPLGLGPLPVAAWLTIAGLVAPAAAQNYRFSVPRMQMQVAVNPDASVTIVYDITFRNGRASRPIDVVDIGTPHPGYRLEQVTASMEGTRLRDIRPSQYVEGFEVHLGRRTIPRGGEGTLHVQFRMPDMVFQDTTREDYASLRITPTWFGSQFVEAPGDIELAVHLPKSVQPDEVLHQGVGFSQKVRTEQGVSVVWQWRRVFPTEPRIVGVSFPKRDLQRVVRVTKFGLLMKWFRGSTQARVVAGIVFLVLFGFLFFRFTGGTGVSVWFLLSALFVWLFYHSPGWHLALMPVVALLAGLNEWYLWRRKASYMPPIAQVEGGGIKRGLTAPEAAALLELPLSRVLGLVIFGMLKKGILRQLEADPLVVDVVEDFRIGKGELLISEAARSRFYGQVARKKGVVVHSYEPPFIYLIQNNPGKPLRQIDFTVPLKELIQHVATRMKGFDLSDTKAYYRRIVKRAVEQAKAIGDVPQREKWIDRHFEWILIDDDYPTVFTWGGPYRPVWTRGTPSAPSAPAAPAPGPSIPGQTTFGDVAASFVGWTENTMGSLASAVSPGKLSPEGASGLIDLSGADRLTADFFQALAEPSSSGGSVGGGCACACAGCACACACAGGGR